MLFFDMDNVENEDIQVCEKTSLVLMISTSETLLR